MPRKFKRRILTGEFKSEKCVQIVKFRSGLELQFIMELDTDPQVVSFEYETLIIPYKRRPQNRKISKYIPDFIVKMADGTIRIVEIKPHSKLKNKVVLEKARYALKWCEEKGYVYEFATEKTMKVSRKQAILIFESAKKCKTKTEEVTPESKRTLKMLF